MATQSLDAIASALVAVDPAHSHQGADPQLALDEWCKLWMLLVGTWYSLHHAKRYLQDFAVNDALAAAHAAAQALLMRPNISLDSQDAVSHMWFAGYFLVSSEHRLANFIDRATMLSIKSGRPPRSIYVRMEALSKQPRFFGAKAVLTRHSSVVKIYQRVNEIKHGREANSKKASIDSLTTQTRWNDVNSALMDAITLLRTSPWRESQQNRHSDK